MRLENSFESYKFLLVLSFHVSYKLVYSMETSFIQCTLIFNLVFIFLNGRQKQSLILMAQQGGVVLLPSTRK